MPGMTEGGSVVLLSGDETDQPNTGAPVRTAGLGFQVCVIDPDSGETATVGEPFCAGSPDAALRKLSEEASIPTLVSHR